MNWLYRCNDCGREFIINDEIIDPSLKQLVPRVYPPYCPYCGRKDRVDLLREVQVITERSR